MSVFIHYAINIASYWSGNETRNGVGTSVRNLKGKGSKYRREDALFSTTCNFYSDKIITPQARFCWTLSHTFSFQISYKRVKFGVCIEESCSY